MTAVDESIASMGLPHHPSPSDIATVLEDAAKNLRKHGLRSIDLAAVLAARGYAAQTLGDGGSRGTDSTSSTERGGLRAVPDSDEKTGKTKPLPPDVRWHLADFYYADLLRSVWKLAANLDSRTSELMRHADDVDPTPAGTGECKGCARYCKPDRNPNNRLRNGLCPTCYRAWRKYKDEDGTELWSAWSSKRREGFTERDSAGNLIAIHTPEPDHDISPSGSGA